MIADNISLRLFETYGALCQYQFISTGIDHGRICHKSVFTDVYKRQVIQGTVYTFDVDESGVQWENNQMIGVSMLKANSTEIIMPYHNIKHKATVYPVGYFSPVSTDEVLYYPEDGSKVDIVADVYKRQVVS